MIEFIKALKLKSLVKVHIILFLFVTLSGLIHIYVFNSHFNIYFFEFLNDYVFSDFKSVFNYSAIENPYDKGLYSEAPANYPPFAYILLKPFVFLGFRLGHLAYLATLLAFIIITFCKLKTSLKINNQKMLLLLIFLLFSHPFLVAIFRGNLDIVIGILLLNILNFQDRKSYIPGILVGIAGAIKVVPLAFCIYFIATRNLKSLATCLLTFFLLSYLTLSYWDITFSSFIKSYIIEYATYKDLYVIGNHAMSFYSDPWLMISGFFKFLGHSELLIIDYYALYNFVQIIWMTFLTIFIFINRDDFSPLFILLLIGMMIIGFPAPSNDYKILYMLPGAMYYLSNFNDNHKIGIHILGIATILMFLHYSFFYVFEYISISSFIRPIIYVVSMLSITYLFITSLFQKD